MSETWQVCTCMLTQCEGSQESTSYQTLENQQEIHSCTDSPEDSYVACESGLCPYCEHVMNAYILIWQDDWWGEEGGGTPHTQKSLLVSESSPGLHNTWGRVSGQGQVEIGFTNHFMASEDVQIHLRVDSLLTEASGQLVTKLPVELLTSTYSEKSPWENPRVVPYEKDYSQLIHVKCLGSKGPTTPQTSEHLGVFKPLGQLLHMFSFSRVYRPTKVCVGVMGQWVLWVLQLWLN